MVKIKTQTVCDNFKSKEKTMFSILSQVGIFGLPLLLVLLSVFFLTIKYSLKLWGAETDSQVDINAIIYLGIFGLMLGVFSYFLGLYEGTKIAAQLRPDQLANGFGIALVSLLYGFAIFLVSAIFWFVLRFRARKLRQVPN